ncbi:hypothetical protein [Endozoicomonas sp. ALB091]|uniref:hypothetical protein n=1 Tax=Endozoicomonas sp. ALB091 TaxID=3403073 RepID=UPI003BB63C21
MGFFNRKDKDQLLDETDAKQKVIIQVRNFQDPVYSTGIESEGRTIVLEHDQKQRSKLHELSKEARGKINSQKITQVRNKIHQKANYEIETPSEIEELKQDYKTAKDQYRAIHQDWQDFRRIHNLSRHAHYPENHFNSAIPLVLVMLIFETLTNSFFFSLASEYGLAEGALVALLLSSCNILISFFTSMSSRYLNHYSLWIKALAYMLVIIFISTAAALALFVGHYRTALEKAPETAHLDAVQSFIESALNLETVSSWILAIISFSVFLVTWYKFFKSDDAYPGYGEITRKMHLMKENINEVSGDAHQALAVTKEKLENEFEIEIEEIKKVYNRVVDAEHALHLLSSEFACFIALQKSEYENFCLETRSLFSYQYSQANNRNAEFSDPVQEVTLQEESINESSNREAFRDFNLIKEDYDQYMKSILPELRESYFSKIDIFIKGLRDSFDGQI